MSTSRQTVLAVTIDITQTSTVAQRTVKLPPGAVPLSVNIVATAAMTGGASPTITFSDGTNSPFASAVTGTSVDAVGKGVLIAGGRVYPNGVDIVAAYTGSPTAAAHKITYQYVIMDRLTEQYIG